jgi:two-component system, cell cycle sensor histidine kinase and response regulator CckA
MLGKSRRLGKWKTANSWQAACNQSNEEFTGRACASRGKTRCEPKRDGESAVEKRFASLLEATLGLRLGPGKHLIPLSGGECILLNAIVGPEEVRAFRDGRRSLKETSKYRTSAIAGAAILMLGHGAVLTLRYGSETASRWGDWIDAAAILLAAFVCWSAARRSGPFGRRVWRLVVFSLLLALVGQVAYTYYFDYLHVSGNAFWPSDILVFFWVVPALMTLFLSPRDPNSGFRWLRFCDFAQVCALVLALELSLVYVPSRWEASERAMANRAFHVGLAFFGLLALSFFVRGILTQYRTGRAFFLRLSGFFFAYAIATNSTLFAYANGNVQQGVWSDLLWTATYCILALIAVNWDGAESEPLKTINPLVPGVQLLVQFSPLVIPAIVFPLVLRIAQEQFFWSVFLVTVSFAGASGRLFVVHRQLLHSSEELEKNLTLLQGITEGTTDAVFVKDLQGRYRMMNSAGARLLGRTVEEVIGKNDMELFNPENGREIMERDREVVQSGHAQTYEEPGISAGLTRTYLSTKGPFRDANDEIVGLLGICRDITDRKRTEEEIRQSQQKLRTHFEHTPLAVVEWDLEFRVAAWNPSAERIFGYTREEAMGKHASFIIPPQFRQHVDRVWQELLKQSGGTRSTNDNVTRNGRHITCEWYNTPLVDDAGRVLGVASLAQDVTERLALEERLRQSQKMEAIGRLAGGVAHDFNNLLTVILGYSQILADGVPEGSRLADSTGQIKSAAERAAGITRQLLAFSRKQVLSPRIINLNDTMMTLDSLLRRLIGEDIEVLTVPENNLGSVKADPGQIEQVIMNLALNARDAMPHGGKLTLETANAQLDEIYASEHQPIVPGRYVMLAVSDTGLGMGPEVQARIFEPFFTTKEVGKGTGLGLSTVYGIVKQTGGYIWVYSEPERGTTFKIYFPSVDQPAETVGPDRRPSTALRGTETILLVEDDPQLRQLSYSVLAHCGYRVLVAGGPEEGLALSKANHRDIRLLITDVVMPGMNGRQLAEQIQRESPKIRVLYISGYTNNAIVHYGVLDKGLWFLPKPFTLSALMGKVREVLDASPDGPQGERGE